MTTVRNDLTLHCTHISFELEGMVKLIDLHIDRITEFIAIVISWSGGGNTNFRDFRIV